MQKHKNKKHLTTLNSTLYATQKILKLKYCCSTYHLLYNQTTQKDYHIPFGGGGVQGIQITYLRVASALSVVTLSSVSSRYGRPRS